MRTIRNFSVFLVFGAFAFVLATLGVAALQSGLFVGIPLTVLSALIVAWALIVLIDFE